MSRDPLTHLYSGGALCAQPSAIRDICALVAKPEVRSLAGGWPDPVKFPLKDIRRIFDKLITEHGDRLFQYGSTEGLLELRQVLADRMKTERMTDVDPDSLIITHGSSQGMHLAAQVFIDREDVVFVGLPTYFGGPGAVRSRGGNVAGIAVDDDGLNVDRLRMEATRLKAADRRVKGVYVIPNFQNPTGVTLSLERRRQLVRLAETHDLIIFEDDPYGELRFEGDPLLSLKSLDRSGRVIHLRSLSKTFVVAKNVAFVTGQPFFVDDSGHNTLRLSYAQAGPQDIEFAIRKIGNLIKAHIVGRKTNNNKEIKNDDHKASPNGLRNSQRRNR